MKLLKFAPWLIVALLLSACEPHKDQVKEGSSSETQAEANQDEAPTKPEESTEPQEAIEEQDDDHLISPETVELVRQKVCVDATAHRLCSTINLSYDETDIDWLDHYLLSMFFVTDGDSNGQAPASIEAMGKDDLLSKMKDNAQSDLQEAKEQLQNVVDSSSIVSSTDYYYADEGIRFVSQRGDIALFKFYKESYEGGAHGMYSNSYLMFDLSTHKRLRLEDIVLSDMESELKTLLKQAYEENYDPEFLKSQDITPNLLSDNFYFDVDGIVFVYPVYELAPYSEGEVKLAIPYTSLTDIIDDKYLINFSRSDQR